MLEVVKVGRWVFLLQEGERTEAQAARARWTLLEEDGDPFLQCGQEKVDLGLELGDAVHLRVARSWHWPWLLAGMRKR